MAEAEHVANCIKSMQDAVSVPITVKTRIGIDDQDSYRFLFEFVHIVSAQGGCKIFTLHARKAWLSGLSPKENREVPPLDYPRVYQLKRDFPALTVAINGGVTNLEEAKQHLKHVDGVMMGREVYRHPGILTQVDRELFDPQSVVINNVAAVKAFYPYIEQELSEGVALGHITRHILGLFQNVPGARQWRRHLSEYAHQPHADISVIEQALSFVTQSTASDIN